jgi:hypothetical protein
MAVITSAQITTVAIIGTTPDIVHQCPQPPPSHIIFITSAFPFGFLDPHPLASVARLGKLLCAFGNADDLPQRPHLGAQLFVSCAGSAAAAPSLSRSLRRIIHDVRT